MLLYKLQPHIGTSWQLIHKGEKTQPNTKAKFALYGLNFSFEVHFILTLHWLFPNIGCGEMQPGKEK